MQVTQREALEVSELLRSEAVTMEVAGFLANQCQDAQLKQILQRHAQEHQRHYSQLLGFVQVPGQAPAVPNAYRPI